MLCFVLVNSVILNLFCLLMLFDMLIGQLISSSFSFLNYSPEFSTLIRVATRWSNCLDNQTEQINKIMKKKQTESRCSGT